MYNLKIFNKVYSPYNILPMYIDNDVYLDIKERRECKGYYILETNNIGLFNKYVKLIRDW
jgi:hypothetical protein